MIKIALTPITFTIDILYLITGTIISALLWDEKYIEYSANTDLNYTRLLWKGTIKSAGQKK